MLYLFSFNSTTETGKMQPLLRLRSTTQIMYFVHLVTSKVFLHQQKYCTVKIKITVYAAAPLEEGILSITSEVF